LIAEKEGLVFKIQADLTRQENVSRKFQDLEMKFLDQMEEIEGLKKSKHSLNHQLDKKDDVIAILRQELDPLQVICFVFCNLFFTLLFTQ
jgi:predicted nuclease with TOPRIM domain